MAMDQRMKWTYWAFQEALPEDDDAITYIE